MMFLCVAGGARNQYPFIFRLTPGVRTYVAWRNMDKQVAPRVLQRHQYELTL